MKKILTLMVSALFAGGAFAQAPSNNAVGLYRTVLDKDYYSEHKTATIGGIVVEPIMGSTTKDVDLDNDENYGTSTEVARFHGTPIEIENNTGRIFPITELKTRDENSFYGFKMTIPEGKTVNIDRLVGQAFCGNAYSWAITISLNGTVLYDTNNLKCNGYNQPYCYMDSVNVTATEASGLSDAAKERTNVAPFGDGSNTEATVMGWVGWKAENLLPATLQNLSGEIEVKMYYFNKVKKVFSVGNLYVELSGIEAGASDAPSATAAGLYRTVLDKDYYSEHKTATALGVAIEPIMGSTTKDVDLDNDENYGTSTEVARFHGTPIEIENGTGRIFPITELKARDENSFYGFKMTIPEGKTVNIDRLVGQAFCGNAYSWAITICQNGTVLYDTNNLKCNGYNQPYCYMDSVNVTATEASGLSDAAKERTNVAPFGDGSNTEATVMGWVGWKAENLLPATLQNLSGEIEVKMYYFNKVKKVFGVGNLYVELSEGKATAISTITSENAVKNGAMYNLAGQRIAAPVKGQIYIKDGKKHIMR